MPNGRSRSNLWSCVGRSKGLGVQKSLLALGTCLADAFMHSGGGGVWTPSFLFQIASSVRTVMPDFVTTCLDVARLSTLWSVQFVVQIIKVFIFYVADDSFCFWLQHLFFRLWSAIDHWYSRWTILPLNFPPDLFVNEGSVLPSTLRASSQ